MLKVGITGGIGVGKTYISAILEKMGYSVFYSDIIAKEIVSKDSRLISLIKQEFGDDIYLADNKIDNKLLSSIVFNDNNKLSKLNSLIHPFVFECFNEWCEKQSSRIVFKEAAILFESNSHLNLEKVICITASKNSRIQRIVKRDGRSLEEINNIMSRQMEQTEKVKLSDYVVENDGDKSILLQISDILEKLEKEVLKNKE